MDANEQARKLKALMAEYLAKRNEINVLLRAMGSPPLELPQVEIAMVRDHAGRLRDRLAALTSLDIRGMGV